MSQEPFQPEEVAALPEESPLSEPAVPLMVICKRCKLVTEDAVYCVHCQVVLKPENVRVPVKPERGPTNPLKPLVYAYVLFLLTSIAFAATLRSNPHLSESQKENYLVTVEVIDGLITLSLFLFLGRQPSRKPKRWKRIVMWLLAPFISVSCYLLGKWYIEMLKNYISSDWLFRGGTQQFTLYEVLTIAVQPALVEELFFRCFAYGVMRQLTNAHAAVILTALMFALAHLYNPFGLPFLFVMGLMLGYARVYSGGLLLPVLMHFAHNFAIIYFESLK
jgi:membrane protease YdiL (CAAX protease family)